MPSPRPIRAVRLRLFTALNHPTRVVVAAFGSAILVGTVLLSLPMAAETGQRTPLVEALFTATSAVCVTGLIVVDTPEYWSTFGEWVILGLIQLGGFGIMTLASLFVLLMSGRLGLRARMLTKAEARTVGPGDARDVVLGVLRTTLLFEAATMAVLTLRLATTYGEPWGRASYLGLFHAVSAFNNAGFSLWSDSLEQFVGDPFMILPVALAVMAGGIGFPVLWEMRRMWRTPRGWSMHTMLTVGVTTILWVLGFVVITVSEWTNRATIGDQPAAVKLLAGFFHTVMPRTAGFNSIHVADMRPETWLATDALMFIGGGSAGTAGGIKVTTFALLGFVIWAELQGEPRVNLRRRRLPEDVQRQALAIALLGVGAVMACTFVLLAVTPFQLDRVLFEIISAFGTVGLSTGITADLPTAGHAMVTVLMFVGRLGPLTLGAALALRARVRRYELPEERPIVG